MCAETNVSVHCMGLRLSSGPYPGLSPSLSSPHPPFLFEGLTTAREEE